MNSKKFVSVLAGVMAIVMLLSLFTGVIYTLFG